MRMSVVALIITLVCAAGVASAQSIGVLDWGTTHPEQQPTASWVGSTGLVLTPTAFTGATMRVNGGYHRIKTDSSTETVYNANLALLPDLELGVARLTNYVIPDPLGATIGNETIANVKLKLDFASWLKVVGGPDIAVGVWDATDKVNRALYIVASKKFSIREKGTLSQFSAHVGFGSTEQSGGVLDGAFGGIDFAVADGLLAQVEYDAQHVNAALHYYPTGQFALDVGLVDSNFAWGAVFQTAY